MSPAGFILFIFENSNRVASRFALQTVNRDSKEAFSPKIDGSPTAWSQILSGLSQTRFGSYALLRS